MRVERYEMRDLSWSSEQLAGWAGCYIRKYNLLQRKSKTRAKLGTGRLCGEGSSDGYACAARTEIDRGFGEMAWWRSAWTTGCAFALLAKAGGSSISRSVAWERAEACVGQPSRVQ
ncbi:hypothetical protein DFH11DRAFT_1541335 [Phellopilus nigrolimitatus]|nr:hypothetical protein DFH11DRAFT_1541335 [Phellopilus nigrolimitatus]